MATDRFGNTIQVGDSVVVDRCIFASVEGIYGDIVVASINDDGYHCTGEYRADETEIHNP